MILSQSDLVGDLSRWASAYIESINALSYSNNTKALYSRVIYSLIEYSKKYNSEMCLRDIRSTFFTGFLSYMEDKAENRGISAKNGSYISKSTKQTYLKAVKNFFTYISDNNDDFFTFERYFKNLKIMNSARMEEKLKYLSEDEVERLLQTLEKEKQKKDDYESHRNSILVKLMLFGGLRISEALNIKLSDFREAQDSNMLRITIYGKGGKDQIGYLFKEKIADELFYFTNIVDLASDTIIMRSKSGNKLDRANAYGIVNTLYKKSNVKQKGLHILRHTLAMRLTEHGVPLVVIKKILRHSNIATTTIYSKATEESVADAMKK